jgi:ABC-type taurine transport system substrate-binding protein
VQYACRKSLADKRPRVRGRFARNDDSTEHLSHMNGHKIEDDDEVGRVMQLIFFSKMDLSFLFNTKNFLTTTSDMSPIELVLS